MKDAVSRAVPGKMSPALRLILYLGLVSMFGDIIYEGARSVNGPYLKVLAANAAVVGLVAGAGEFIGYALRLLTGYLSDRTRSYWVSVFIGYGLLVSVPLLALAGAWQAAAALILMERIARLEAVDADASRQMIAILERQQFNEVIPALLPPGTRVAHKTGSITRINHDAAIVLAPRPFVLVVLVRGIEDHAQSASLIAKIARLLYDESQRP